MKVGKGLGEKMAGPRSVGKIDYEALLEVLATVPRKNGKRRLYVRKCDPTLIGQFKRKNYDVVDVLTMSRSTAPENVAYLLALTQGIEEGTIAANAAQMKALELDLKIHGLLDKITKTFNLGNTAHENVDEAMKWAPSRHATTASADVKEENPDD